MNVYRLSTASRVLRQGGVIAYPTEAVFGLGSDPRNESAVRKVLALKHRPAEAGPEPRSSARAGLPPGLSSTSHRASARRTPPVTACWHDLAGEVRHTFTHFHLILSVRTARVGPKVQPERGDFVARQDFRPSDLPTVMRKVWALVEQHKAP